MGERASPNKKLAAYVLIGAALAGVATQYNNLLGVFRDGSQQAHVTRVFRAERSVQRAVRSDQSILPDNVKVQSGVAHITRFCREATQEISKARAKYEALLREYLYVRNLLYQSGKFSPGSTDLNAARAKLQAVKESIWGPVVHLNNARGDLARVEWEIKENIPKGDVQNQILTELKEVYSEEKEVRADIGKLEDSVNELLATTQIF